jgi:hypothetical protein
VNIVIDDHLLREVLLEHEPTWLRRIKRRGQLSTTGCWYYRLCSALHEPNLIGSLSGPVAELPPEPRAAVIELVVRLPPSIRLLPLREVAWSAAGFGRRYGLNLLAAEALAAAVASTAAIATASANLPPKLRLAAEQENVRVLTLDR